MTIHGKIPYPEAYELLFCFPFRRLLSLRWKIDSSFSLRNVKMKQTHEQTLRFRLVFALVLSSFIRVFIEK
jgi:hypothetical protein